jgi:hypothetical protein
MTTTMRVCNDPRFHTSHTAFDGDGMTFLCAGTIPKDFVSHVEKLYAPARPLHCGECKGRLTPDPSGDRAFVHISLGDDGSWEYIYQDHYPRLDVTEWHATIFDLAAEVVRLDRQLDHQRDKTWLAERLANLFQRRHRRAYAIAEDAVDIDAAGRVASDVCHALTGEDGGGYHPRERAYDERIAAALTPIDRMIP